MERTERQRLKALANEAIIATYGDDGREQRLAEALEKAVDHIQYLRAEYRPICDNCDQRCRTYDEAEEDGMI